MKSTVLIKYSGKYIEIYFKLKITFFGILFIFFYYYYYLFIYFFFLVGRGWIVLKISEKNIF